MLRDSRKRWLSALALSWCGLAAGSCALPQGPNQSSGSDAGASTTPPTGQVVTASIGEAGGSLASSDGTASMEVPAESLYEDAQLSLQTLPKERLPTAPPLPVVGTSVVLTPHGTLFDKPVTVHLNYDQSIPVDQLQVLRLNDEKDPLWEPVDGATFQAGVATFETNTFSLYSVTQGSPSCWPAAGVAACGGTCNARSYCTSSDPAARTCVATATNNVCGNLTISWMANTAYATDVTVGQSLASAFLSLCPGSTATQVAVTDGTVENQCTGEPMLPGGNTILLAGSALSQPMILNLGATVSPIALDIADDGQAEWTRRGGGGVIVKYPFTPFQTTEDYFAVQLYPDPVRGSLIFSAYGQWAAGTTAANYYVQNTVIPQLKAKTRLWDSYILVHWVDQGAAGPDASDQWTVVEQDTIPVTPPPPPAPLPPETPWNTGKTGSIVTMNAPAIAGYDFTPLKNGTITALGTNAVKGSYSVNLYANGTIYTAKVTVATTQQFSYATLATPVPVVAGTTYTVAVVLPKPTGFFASAAIGESFSNPPAFPRTYGNVSIVRSVSVNNVTNSTLASSRPVNKATGMAGSADVIFQPSN